MNIQLALLTVLLSVVSSLGAPQFPLQVSANHRHLEDASGKAFLVVGDTAWSLIAQLKPDEAIAYLDDRQRRGFNAIIVSLIEHKFADRAPALIDGTQPFLAPGDYALPNNERWAGHEVALGLRDGGARQLITAHGGQTTAVDTFGDQPWLALDTVYRYQDDLWRPVQANWPKLPTRPYVMIESAYEGEHQATPARLRAQAWWSMTSGACGQFFGNNPIWYFDGRAYDFAKRKSAPNWRAALDLTGSRDIARLAAFFAKLPWPTLEPDLEGRVITTGAGDGKGRATCAVSADGGRAILYLPSPRAITVNLARFRGQVVARWFDPTSGEFRTASDKAHPHAGEASFSDPGRNAAGDTDWVLVLEAR